VLFFFFFQVNDFEKANQSCVVNFVLESWNNSARVDQMTNTRVGSIYYTQRQRDLLAH
jgi:hypothetical protein